MATCFLIASVAGAAGSAAARLARLRGARVVHCLDFDALPGRLPRPSMVAIGAWRLRTLSGRQRRHLANLVAEGATLYVRGVAHGSVSLDLRPFAPVELAIAPERSAVGYRFTTNPTLPAALAGEQVAGELFEAPGVERGVGAGTEELLLVRHVDGVERAAIFLLRYGRGCVIHDLHQEDETGTGAPLLERLAHRAARPQYAGALVAANCAAGIQPATIPPFNLAIDDRPANFDHFNAAPMSALLRHIDHLCPGAHVDFAWTPCQSRPCRSYLEAMKGFSTGFVWHGLWRHVDHRAIAHPAAELAKGRRTVERIERRLGIRFQPIMIFPFERSASTQYPLLAQAGFLASVEESRYPSCSDPHPPGCPGDALASRTDPTCGFDILYRYAATSLTRDRMLAMAALGLPIIAFAHPGDVGLRRLSGFWNRGGDVSHFDEVLKFASSKRLPSRSLEEIAAWVTTINPNSDRLTQVSQAAVEP